MRNAAFFTGAAPAFPLGVLSCAARSLAAGGSELDRFRHIPAS